MITLDKDGKTLKFENSQRGSEEKKSSQESEKE